jgi:hypothetical protein
MPRFSAAQYHTLHGSYQEARTGKISQIEVSTLSGEPRALDSRDRSNLYNKELIFGISNDWILARSTN